MEVVLFRSRARTGFMSNRYTGDNIRLIYDLIYYLNYINLPGLLISIDFENAFDSVDWNFMMKVLKAFGFGPIIMSVDLHILQQN